MDETAFPPSRVPHGQPSAEPRYLGKSLQQLVQELHSLDGQGPGSGDASRNVKDLVEALVCFGLLVMPALELTMREGSPKAREVAVRGLAGMGPAAVAHLVSALNDEDHHVQAVAAFFLASMPPKVPLDAQVMGFLLDERRPHLLKAAIAAWAALGNTPGSAVPALTRLLRERKIAAEADDWPRDTPDFSARIDLLKALGRARPPALDALFLAMRDDEPAVRIAAAEILTDVARDDARTVAALRDLLRDSDPRIQTAGAAGIKKCIPDNVALSHPEPAARAATVSALCKIEPDEKAIDVLIEGLQDIEGECFRDAAEAVAAIGPPAGRAVPVLIETLKNNQANYIYHRSLAIEALGAIGTASEAAVPYLVHAILHDSDYCFDGCAVEAIGKIGDRGIAPLVEALGDGSVHVRVAAAEAVGQLGPPAASAVPGLVGMLDENDMAAQITAAKALGRIGKQSSHAERTLHNLLESQSRRVRCTAKRALKQIGIEREIRSLENDD